jgi:6-phosphofructokinase 1
MKSSKTGCIGILTSGGDCPGLNAAIRGVAKAALAHGIKVVGILDGFRGLAENRTIPLVDLAVSGILTHGGTILGTSRDKPHKMLMGEQIMDMTGPAVKNARRLGIECLVCLGGGGTQKNALHLLKEGGLNVMTLPKTIDNDVAFTDISFGFDTALSIATEAIDRLHTTATSHHRMIICEIMGHTAGWLALGAGIAGGADVIMIPEIPYDLEVVAAHLLERRRSGKRFSIIAVAEGAVSKTEAARIRGSNKKALEKKAAQRDRELLKMIRKLPGRETTQELHVVQEPMASRLARQIQYQTGIEVRLTSLGHVQRGGTPTPTDRLLCTRLGTTAAELLFRGVYNVMVAVQGAECVPVPLEKVAGKVKLVPPDHAWLRSAKLVGTCLGDEL